MGFPLWLGGRGGSWFGTVDASHHFVLVAVKTSGVLGPEALLFFQDLGHCLKETIGEQRYLQLSYSACR